MARRWDKVGRLALFPPSGEGAPDPSEKCMAFLVPKPGTDPFETRHISDRRARNRKDAPLRTGSKWLPHGSQWLDLYIPKGMRSYFSSNDLRHFYHSFARVSRERARTMVVGIPYRMEELKGLSALQRDADFFTGHKSALVAFAGLGMGDGAAVDIAEESHCNVQR